MPEKRDPLDVVYDVAIKSPLDFAPKISKVIGANVYLKREDIQEVHSFKIRGAYNKIAQLRDEEKRNGVIAASAGNHAQGIAYCCNKFKIRGTIFMPEVTPKLKINMVKNHGGQWLDIRLIGLTFDDAVAAANDFK